MRKLLAAAAAVATAALSAGAAHAQSGTGIGVTTTRTAGVTSATAGTFVQALPLAGGVYQRRNCQVTNTSGNPETVDVGPTPSALTARPLAAGATFDCAGSSGNVLLDQVWIASTTASSTFVVWTQQ